VKSENNLQGDSSFKGLQSLSTLFLVSSLAQIAQHQLTVLSRLGVHVCITFCVAFNMNNINIAQATFFVAVSAYIQHCIKKCVPFCDFWPPCCDILATALAAARKQYRSCVAISLTIACSRYIYNGADVHAHPVRGESHNQRNATGEVATV